MVHRDTVKRPPGALEGAAPARGMPAALILAAAMLAPALRAAARAEEGPVRIREIYVPYAEFEKLTQSKPDGLVMALEEYRELVRQALRNSRREPPQPLPPLESALISASYRGKLQGKVARIEGTLKVRVSTDGWVRCDLGAPLPSLGSILVNDRPGWIIVEEQAPAQAQGQAAQPQAQQAQPAQSQPAQQAAAQAAPAARRAYLLLRGKGEHMVTLTFSLPAVETEDRWTLEGPVPPAASCRIDVDVPGQVEATAEPGFVQVTPGESSTALALALGTADRFKIQWRRKRGSGEKEIFLAAEHRVEYVPRRDDPVFAWESTVTVARRKVDALVFREAPLMRVLEVSGPLVHSWERVQEGLRVTLKEPVLGDVLLRLTGVLEPAGERFVLGPPALSDAFSNTGHLALYEPATAKLALEAAVEVSEASLAEARAASVFGAPEASGLKPKLWRIYSFRSGEARLTVTTSGLPVRFEAHATFLARAGEGNLFLEGVARALPREGRLYRFQISLPAPWKITGIGELTPSGQGHGLSFEESGPPESRILELRLARAAAPGEPVEIQLRVDHDTFGEERGWETKSLDLQLPAILGAERSRTDLGLAIPTSMDALMADIPAWRSLAPDEVKRLGLNDAVAKGGAGSLVAGLTTGDPAPRLSFDLVHRPPRGEYRAVTHILALERILRARVDIRVAAVDRPIEALIFRLPPSAGPSAVILGPGVKEIETDAASGSRTVRFSKPWLGTREFRVEYEASQESGAPSPIPSIEVEPAGATRGVFGGERFVVLQSQGPVEISASIGPGLSPVDPDEMPDFAAPWSGGRLLRAYRFRAAGDPGTFRTLIHDRAPVLSRLARKMTLTTVIGPEGVSRTHVEILLAYSREQSFTVDLPADARCLAVTVNGEPLRAVVPVAPQAGAQARQSFSIPLPAQSYATVTLAYERTGRGAAGGTGGAERLPPPLGNWGEWVEEAPGLPGIPVGETFWAIHWPEGHRFHVRGGNLRPLEPGGEEPFGFFADSFLGRIFTGRLPVFTALAPQPRAGVRVSIPDLTAEEALGAESRAGEQGRGQNRIEPQQVGAAGAGPKRSVAPAYQLLPEGRRITATKIGGDARFQLFHVSDRWWGFSRKAVFLGAATLAWFILLSRGSGAFWRTVVWMLFLGTLVPLAIGWRSPLLLVPLCEGLAAMALVVGAVQVAARLRGRVRHGDKVRNEVSRATVVCCLAACAGLLAGPARSAETVAPGTVAPGGDAGSVAKAIEGVVIPYDPEEVKDLESATGKKVYLPYSKFLELWNLAHPDRKVEEERAPVDVVLGGASYVLRLEGDMFRLQGLIEVNILTDRWVALPLPFERSQIAGIRLDGAEIGVAAGTPGDRVPFIEVKGRKPRKLEIDLVGAVHRSPGEYKVLTGLMAGAAAALRAELPAGAKVEGRGTGARDAGRALPLVVTEEAGTAPADATAKAADSKSAGKTIVTADLGGADRIELVWSFPKIEGQTGSQVESLSYSSLVPDLSGYRVDRRERLRVTGRRVDAVEYAISGGLRITEVAGVDVSEWSVLADAGAPAKQRLQVFFAKPVEEADLRIRGRAALQGSGPLATLALALAARQETFVGVHGSGRLRFAPDVLAGMRRASREDLLISFPMSEGEIPDRIYQAYGSGEDQSVAISVLPGEATLATDVLAVVEADRMVVTARTRYNVKDAGPLRHEVLLPGTWTVRTVQCDALRAWEVVRSGDSNRLVITFAERAPGGLELTWTAEAVFPSLPETVSFPALAAAVADANLGRETMHWILAAGDELELSVRDQGGLLPVALDAAPRWLVLPPLCSYRFALRSWRSEARTGNLVVAVARQPSQLRALVVSFARVAEDFLHVNARIAYRMPFSGRDRFRIALPQGAELVSLESLNQRSRDVRPTPAGIEIEVVLQSAAAREHSLGVEYRIRRQPGAMPVLLPIRVYDVKEPMADVEEYVGVLQTRATVISASAAAGLSPVEAETLPYLPAGVSASSLSPTYRATLRDWRLTLSEELIVVGEALGSIVELAEISTVISSDGKVRTRVAYTVRNRNLQFLVVELPERADLWGVTLNGKPVAVGRTPGGPDQAQGRIEIPVEHVGSASLNLEVVVQYEEPPLSLPALRGAAQLRAPRVIDTQVLETLWNVHFPEGYSVRMSGGNMREVPGSTQYAKKLRNLLDQFQKLSKVAGESDSARVRAQAEREISRLEQALGDNLAELQEGNRSAQEWSQAGRIGKTAVEEQWDYNDALIRESQQAQQQLRETREKREKEGKGKAPPSKEEQAFLDTNNFLKRSWFDNKAVQQRVEQRPEQAAAGALTLDALVEESPFQGLLNVTVSKDVPVAELSQPTPVDAAQGLKPVPEISGPAAAPAMEMALEPKGYETYTFHLLRGDAEVELSFLRKDAAPRLAAILALVVVPVTLVFLARRKLGQRPVST